MLTAIEGQELRESQNQCGGDMENVEGSRTERFLQRSPRDSDTRSVAVVDSTWLP